MSAYVNAFKAEVQRVVARSIKREVEKLRQSSRAHRTEIASLKKEVTALGAQVKSLTKELKRSGVVSFAEPKPRGRNAFGPQALAEKRAALNLTLKEMGLLLEASPLSVARWESGKAIPREAQRVRIYAVLKMGKREVSAKLAPK